jgi:drug/metabolite transporter (DMT)-like permease
LWYFFALWGDGPDILLRRFTDDETMSIQFSLAFNISVPGRWRAGAQRLGGLFEQAPLFWGVLLMLTTTGLWAVAFVAPILMNGSRAAEITIGRFLVYGAISVASLSAGGVRSLPWRNFGIALVLALAGNVAFYFILTLGIQLSGATFTILIFGMVPVTVSLFGRMAAKEGALKVIALPLIVFMVGVVTFNLGKTDFLRDMSDFSALGTLLLLGCLAMWTWYAIANSRFLHAHRGMDPGRWNALIGTASLVAVLAAAPVFYALGELRDPFAIPRQELHGILFWSVVLGAGSTWLAYLLFNIAARLLKVSLLGQLIIFEAVFGVAYVFLASGKLPNLLELAGLAVALVGIWWSIRRLQAEAPLAGA